MKIVFAIYKTIDKVAKDHTQSKLIYKNGISKIGNVAIHNTVKELDLSKFDCIFYILTILSRIRQK